ncbi:MAG: hypothetical protein GX066_01505 [Clostridiaceae bacterium]|nr:hypothetical protein [Clostridiaceae bacterium]
MFRTFVPKYTQLNPVQRQPTMEFGPIKTSHAQNSWPDVSHRYTNRPRQGRITPGSTKKVPGAPNGKGLCGTKGGGEVVGGTPIGAPGDGLSSRGGLSKGGCPKGGMSMGGLPKGGCPKDGIP